MPRSTLTTPKLHGTTQTKAAANEIQNTNPTENHFSSAFCAVVMASLRNAYWAHHTRFDAIAAMVYVGLAPARTETATTCERNVTNSIPGRTFALTTEQLPVTPA